MMLSAISRVNGSPNSKHIKLNTNNSLLLFIVFFVLLLWLVVVVVVVVVVVASLLLQYVLRVQEGEL